MRQVQVASDYKSYTALPVAAPWVDNDYELLDFDHAPVFNASSNITYEYIVGVTYPNTFRM